MAMQITQVLRQTALLLGPRRILWLGLLLSLLTLSPVVTAQEPQKTTDVPTLNQQIIEDLLHDDFLGLYMAGKKTGWARHSLKRVKHAQSDTSEKLDVWRLRFYTAFTQNLNSEMYFDFRALPPFDVLYMRETTTIGSNRTIVELKQTAGKSYVRSNSTLDTNTKILPAIDYTLQDYLADRRWIRAGASVGQEMRGRHYDLAKLKLMYSTATVRAIDSTFVNGVALPIYTIEYYEPEEDQTTTSRYDHMGNSINSDYGDLMTVRVEPADIAKNIDQNVDLFADGTVPIDKPLGDPTTLMEVELLMRGEILPQLPQSADQKISKTEAGLLINIGTGLGSPQPAGETEVSKYLKPSIEIPGDHPRFRKMAADITDGMLTQQAKVAAILQFTHEFIEGSYTAQPLTIWDILQERSGDCTEYSLLFNTLARAAGIPSRRVHGLMYMGDNHKTFGLHAWNEVVLDGHWQAVDAAWNEATLSPQRIRFNSEGDAYARDYAALFNGLELELRRTETRKQ